MGVSISTDAKNLTIYRKDGTGKNGNPYTLYSTKFSSKDTSGEWVSVFVGVTMPRGTDIPTKSEIKVNNGFIGVDTFGEAKLKLVVTDFEVIGGQEPGETSPDGLPAWLSGSDVDDLPFV